MRAGERRMVGHASKADQELASDPTCTAMERAGIIVKLQLLRERRSARVGGAGNLRQPATTDLWAISATESGGRAKL